MDLEAHQVLKIANRIKTSSQGLEKVLPMINRALRRTTQRVGVKLHHELKILRLRIPLSLSHTFMLEASDLQLGFLTKA